MKNFLFIAFIFIQSNLVNAQTYAWTQKSNFGGGTRYAAAGFSINGKGYMGLGITHVGWNYTYYNDFWEYNPATNVWTQKANFPGQARNSSSGFAINQKGYIVLGWAPAQLNDLWEFDPVNNSWAQKTNFGGPARYDAAAFVVGNYAYVGCGYNPYQKDFWQYDPSNDSWTQIADIGGNPRSAAKGFSAGGFGYVVAGGEQFVLYTSDLWRYNPASNLWAQMTGMPGGPRVGPAAFSIGNLGFTGLGCTDIVVYNDFYSYDPIADAWSPVPNYPGLGRIHCVTYTIGNCAYVCAGSDSIYPGGTDRGDLWCLCDVTGVSENNSLNNNISVSANAAHNTLTIKFNKPNEGKAYIQIFSVNGKLINSETSKAANEIEISTVNFSKGNYLIEIFNDRKNKIYSGKISID
ncbi:MAG: T9SS type A sorting domain-containing protein [Bacteroidia bacterium]